MIYAEIAKCFLSKGVSEYLCTDIHKSNFVVN